ncbi:CoA-binding protein [Jannaschia sp. R86511]|uniref:CoA-binding protein n=1 Tax=Jannaschia sp. R86511 TaxID=3093853 RepID=UPI0036D3AC36
MSETEVGEYAGGAAEVPAATTGRGTRTWEGPSAQQRLGVLRRTRTVAVVGASDNPARASYFVSTYLLSTSPYEVYFVNPRVTEILGRPVYDSLAALPVVPDLVDVFRAHDALPGVLAETVAVGARTLWLQLGLWHEQVARDGEAAGLEVVMDRCLKIEHARFHGGLHLAGFDTGVISSRRRKG